MGELSVVPAKASLSGLLHGRRYSRHLPWLLAQVVKFGPPHSLSVSRSVSTSSRNDLDFFNHRRPYSESHLDTRPLDDVAQREIRVDALVPDANQHARERAAVVLHGEDRTWEDLVRAPRVEVPVEQLFGVRGGESLAEIAHESSALEQRCWNFCSFICRLCGFREGVGGGGWGGRQHGRLDDRLGQCGEDALHICCFVVALTLCAKSLPCWCRRRARRFRLL